MKIEDIFDKYKHTKIEHNGNYAIIINGDSEEILKQIKSKIFDAIITDPPYLFSEPKHVKISEKRTDVSKRINRYSNKITFISNGFDYTTYFQLFSNVCKKARYSIFCSNKQVGKFMTYFEERNFRPTIMVWHKKKAIPAVNNTYLPNLEFVVNVRESGSFFNNDLTLHEKSKVWYGCSVVKNKKNNYHPTEKPIPLLQWQIKSISKEGDLLLDPFSGSGSSAIACLQLNRNCICIEKDENYYNLSIDKIKNNLGLF